MVLLGLTAGYSLSILGSVSGSLLGAAGFSAAGAGYYKFGCWGECGSRAIGLSGCDCSGDCDDSCSYDA